MNFTPARILFGSLALTGLLVVAAGCNGGKTGEGKANDSIDTPKVIHVEPQNFPVNELPDNYFGKATLTKEVAGLKVTDAKLIPSTEPFPEWLDQILSRESIVRFSSTILKAVPEEVEFVQTASQSLDAGGGLRAFVVSYTTRPSNWSMVVYGAYIDEDRAFWASHVEKEKLEMAIKAVQSIEGGMELMGERTVGDKKQSFKATLKKETTNMETGK